MSASIHWMPWNSEMGRPNCALSWEYARAFSKAHWAVTSDMVELPHRSALKAIIIFRNPSSLISTFPAGTMASSKKS